MLAKKLPNWPKAIWENFPFYALPCEVTVTGFFKGILLLINVCPILIIANFHAFEIFLLFLTKVYMRFMNAPIPTSTPKTPITSQTHNGITVG